MTIKLYRLPEVLGLVGLSRSTVYRLIQEGAFPVPVKLGQRAVAWRSSEIHAWIESRVSAVEVAQ